MQIKMLYQRTLNLLLRPALEFSHIREEALPVATINRRILVPFALLTALCSFLGSLLQHLDNPVDSYLFVLLDATIVFLIIMFQTYIAGLLIARISKWMAMPIRRRVIYALVVYAEIPFFLVLALVKLFPSLMFLIFLGLYSGYLFYAGAGTLFNYGEQKKLQLVSFSVITMIAIFILSSELFSMIYFRMVNEFSNFALF